MSGKLLTLKKQIKSIKNTAKITKAMELVAASKMKQFQRKTQHVRSFVFDLLYVMTNQIQLSDKSVFVHDREKGKEAFIIYSSDKGLCGSLNQRLFKTLTSSKLWKETPEENRMVITIGKKAQNFCHFNKITVDHYLEAVPETLDTYSAAAFIDQIINIWTSGDVRRVHMVAPHYKNSLVFYPMMKQFLPLSKGLLEAHMNIDPDSVSRDVSTMKNTYVYCDSDEDDVSEEVTYMTAKLIFIHAFYELKASEYSSRMVAMKNATDSAKKIQAQKTLVLNKERQSVITQQISEIVGGSL